MAWFTLADLQADYPYDKVANASSTFVESVTIPSIEGFIRSFISGDAYRWDLPPADVLLVAKNMAVNRILADDETIRIAQARGQPSITIAGDTINLDLTPGRNFLLSTEDEAVLTGLADGQRKVLHTDKVVVKSQGGKYTNAPGGDTNPSSTDLVRSDSGLPRYFTGQ